MIKQRYNDEYIALEEWSRKNDVAEFSFAEIKHLIGKHQKLQRMRLQGMIKLVNKTIGKRTYAFVPNCKYILRNGV